MHNRTRVVVLSRFCSAPSPAKKSSSSVRRRTKVYSSRNSSTVRHSESHWDPSLGWVLDALDLYRCCNNTSVCCGAPRIWLKTDVETTAVKKNLTAGILLPAQLISARYKRMRISSPWSGKQRINVKM